MGDRAVPTKNFCNVKCLQPQDRKIVIKSLAALMIQGTTYASHLRPTAWLQHHKPQICYTHGSSSTSWENLHCKWGHWGVGRSSHPAKMSQAGSSLWAQYFPRLVLGRSQHCPLPKGRAKPVVTAEPTVTVDYGPALPEAQHSPPPLFAAPRSPLLWGQQRGSKIP